MKYGSTFVNLVVLGFLGAAVMFGCSSDDPEASVSTTSEGGTSTTVEATTTTLSSTTTTSLTTTSLSVAQTTTMPPITQAPPTTPPTTQAPPTTLPPVKLGATWSGINAGCPVNHDLILYVNVLGATSAGKISVRVGGISYSGSDFAIGDTMKIDFDYWPQLANDTYPVTVTASSATQGPTTVTTSVTYNCPI